ncbi:oxidoreductase [Micromonospora sp. WMMD961]|uniref:oxidoreductase n=1 Tax=Micromonospora sp. WMMD961 TaxID=3016100 RepID=UPI0024166CE5|nr:oxidoreductase [Micromonospora sp. WMMD961]MDG4782479.1 oxidoreductase [Micromonospora sp. WMMD961]
MSVWFITGASRGLGAQIVREALAAGHQVVAGARNPQHVAEQFGPSDALLPVALDVTDPGQVAAAVKRAREGFERIDVLVNNAGFSVLGAVEEISDAEALAMFEVNVFGVHRVTRAVLPTMREQRSGRIINIGSVGGFAAVASSGLYGATKFALEAISEALDLEARDLGIYTTVIEPGAFRTDFLTPQSMRLAATVIDDYAATAGAARTAFSTANGQQPGDPAKAARAILTLTDLEDPPIRLQLGSDSIARVQGKLARVADDLARWRHLGEATNFEA